MTAVHRLISNVVLSECKRRWFLHRVLGYRTRSGTGFRIPTVDSDELWNDFLENAPTVGHGFVSRIKEVADDEVNFLLQNSPLDGPAGELLVENEIALVEELRKLSGFYMEAWGLNIFPNAGTPLAFGEGFLGRTGWSLPSTRVSDAKKNPQNDLDVAVNSIQTVDLDGKTWALYRALSDVPANRFLRETFPTKFWTMLIAGIASEARLWKEPIAGVLFDISYYPNPRQPVDKIKQRKGRNGLNKLKQPANLPLILSRDFEQYVRTVHLAHQYRETPWASFPKWYEDTYKKLQEREAKGFWFYRTAVPVSWEDQREAYLEFAPVANDLNTLQEFAEIPLHRPGYRDGLSSVLSYLNDHRGVRMTFNRSPGERCLSCRYRDICDGLKEHSFT